jgi:sterol desaturase/sphingolipid hydroxylase (fatty acid hydroxylase superfamily)
MEWIGEFAVCERPSSLNPGIGRIVNAIDLKKTIFRWLQPATVLVILAYWSLAPAAWTKNPFSLAVAGSVTTAMIQCLEWINERHAGWRLDAREFTTDLFYVLLGTTVIGFMGEHFADKPLEQLKHILHLQTLWLGQMPIAAQAAIVFVLIEFGQYWMHRVMHHSVLWLTHGPHHHITQLNAMKGAVGNPLELFLIGLSVVSLFDFSLPAIFCGTNLVIAVSSFAHANARFGPPRWYSFLFTTIEHHSLHHSVGFEETRCNYANCFILWDRIFGTYRDGESAIVGQDERKRLSIWEQFVFPLRPVIAMVKALNRPGLAGG